MKQLITAARVRDIIADARTEKQAADLLRIHRVKYKFSTEGGAFHISIPARSGVITITRTASRNRPLTLAIIEKASRNMYRFPAPVVRSGNPLR